MFLLKRAIEKSDVEEVQKLIDFEITPPATKDMIGDLMEMGSYKNSQEMLDILMKDKRLDRSRLSFDLEGWDENFVKACRKYDIDVDWHTCNGECCHSD